MRVISGKYGSRPLKAVPGVNTRPTTDKIKESLFNLLGGRFDGGTVLDLYGGTGGLAIESISRGMDSAVICEKNFRAIEIIKQNIAVTKETERFTILAGDNRVELMKWINRSGQLVFNQVFIDPPYKLEKIEADINWLTDNQLIGENSIIICETDDETFLPDEIEHWTKYREKKYGLTCIHLYKWKELR